VEHDWTQETAKQGGIGLFYSCQTLLMHFHCFQASFIPSTTQHSMNVGMTHLTRESSCSMGNPCTLTYVTFLLYWQPALSTQTKSFPRRPMNKTPRPTWATEIFQLSCHLSLSHEFIPHCRFLSLDHRWRRSLALAEATTCEEVWAHFIKKI